MSQDGEVRVMDDQLNVPLEDSELLAEVELTTNLIIAASESDTPLPQDEVDRLLGLEDRQLDPHPAGPQPLTLSARVGWKLRSRSEFPTTHTLDAAIAAPAIIGSSRPSAATGMPTTL